MKEIIQEIKNLNDSDTHIIIAFIFEVVSAISTVWATSKWLTKFSSASDKNKNNYETRDIIIIGLYTLILFLLPLAIGIWVFPKLFSFWVVVVELFSLMFMGSYIVLIFLFRKISKYFNEIGLNTDDYK